MKIVIMLLLALSSFPITPQEPTLADKRPEWSIGVAAFEGRNLSPENVYLTRSVPMLIRERLEAIPDHYFSAAEVLAYRRRIIQEERQRLVEAVSADRRARDELFFTSDSVQANAAVYEQRIAANLAAIRDLGDLDPELIAFPQSKPLRFVSGADGQLVFDKTVLSPLQLAKQQDLDVLLWGGFEEVQGFLYFEITLFSAVLGEPVYTYSDAAAPSEIYDLFDQLITELATVLWGRDWSSLTVQTVPPGASVWIDGQFQGRTPLSIPYLLPGGRQLLVQDQGFESVLRTIELSPYTEQVTGITLVPRPRELLTLDSDPAGATVYQGSEWLGSTPLSIERPEELSRLLLRREGYLDFPLYTRPPVGASLTAELLPDSVDLSKIQDSRRDELYTALGVFALSLPIPMFSWGYRNDYIATATSLELQGKTAQSQEALATANIYTGVSLGTMAVSGGLFVNLLVRLIRYLRAADRKA
jgi:hypothetical protein